ncbi:glutaredoxin domain-containing protein [Micromonospora siamensis]|uniref:glutaredoxin domain-containing protein n=1 Tax=Micromonospora siamensis TaxID=299152 RepID=UPI001E5CFFD3|nr:glutaredoxin domain-containing protein [Micromonospora siamensis]
MATTSFAGGSPAAGTVQLLLFVVLAVLLSPLPFPRSSGDAAAEDGADDGRPVVYWRPGCPYCLRLRARLGRDARLLSWVNIWSDPAGAAVVRAAAGGNETVPTVVVRGQAFVNPDPGWLQARLRAIG